MEEDRLGEEASRRLHDEEIAQLERKRAEVQRKRQQDVIDYAMYYNEADWLNIRAQVKANASLSKTLLVGKLVKKVKALKVKLKTKKRKIVVSDSDQEDVKQQDVDLDALCALANAAMTVDSNIPSGGTSQIPAASPRVSTAGPP
nr:hypothetical protein [Tanacetum cinerariifolium]